ncbi:MAG: N-acetylmuramoyl-L-alanine amidase [Clostridia bacterium]|nr:N-acetylmuramoyl-L-alanine amidase [Clostridia bacterium]
MKPLIQHFVIKRLSDLRICLLIVLVFTAVSLLLPPAARPVESALSLSSLTVALDPGHGGYDGGARAHDSGVWEKELTLPIALAVEEELLACGAQVILTRREDVCLAEGDTATKARKRADLQARRDMAENGGADVLLSIHLNEYRSRAESGPQVFYQQGCEDGRKLAEALQQTLIETLKPEKQRKAMAGDYYVLRGRLPSALVECGFISNAKEEKKLRDPAYHKQIASAVADGLAKWLSSR